MLICTQQTQRILQPFEKMFFRLDFVLVHPLDTNIYLVWMGRVLMDVQLDRNRYQYRQIQIRC